MSSRYTKQTRSLTGDAWKIAKATVTLCRPRFFSGGRIDSFGGPASPTIYVATFEYEVQDQKYRGKIERSTPVVSGHHFQISYSPAHPSHNTGSEFQPVWLRIIAWTIGAALAALGIYLKNR
jgi:hypothetical protein